jgi:3-hydroxyisobutyrate dehydrogenase-like beta-hydroxyacid dehydrogenase
MKNEASVIGLGTMGIVLARLLLRNGDRVTVWNPILSCGRERHWPADQ